MSNEKDPRDRPGGAPAANDRTDVRLWRSLGELQAASREREGEFPPGADQPPARLERRTFLKLLGASAGLASAAACGYSTDRLYPYVDRPPEVTPGIAQHYATSMVLGGHATGLIVESHVGRPTKIEGNPDHPASLGAAGPYEQASVLELYEPARAGFPRRGTSRNSWLEFAGEVRPEPLKQRCGQRGAGLRLLLEPSSSPLLADMQARVQSLYPEARVHYYAPLATTSPREGTRLVFGRPLQPQFDFSGADVVFSLDADFLAGMPFHLRYARQFADRRRLRAPSGQMNRLYVAEGPVSVTGTMADNRLRVQTGRVIEVAAALLARVASIVGPAAAGAPGIESFPQPAALAALEALHGGRQADKSITAAAQDLRDHAGRSIVIAGDRQPPIVHALAHLLNAMLGNIGRTVSYIEPTLAGNGGAGDLSALVDDIRSGQVSALLVSGVNAAYAAPADIEFAKWLRKVPFTVYHGLFEDETAEACGWFLPASHYLESWGDARAYDGTVSFVQPLIAPLYDSRSLNEVLDMMATEHPRHARDLLHDFWQPKLPNEPDAWKGAVQLGLLRGSASPAAPVTARWDATVGELQRTRPAAAANAIEIVFSQDPCVYDGRFSANGWLQELPDPITKLTWGNAARMSDATARRIGVTDGQVVELRHEGRTVMAATLAVPGLVDDEIELQFGYGRTVGAAHGGGANAYAIWTSRGWFGPASADTAMIAGVHRIEKLAITQEHWTLEGRPIALNATLHDYRHDPSFTEEQKGKQLTLYPPYPYKGKQWAMAIDLSVCTGCSACVIACQAENNIPVVGKEEVLKGREMHWLRVDRYYQGSPDKPHIVMQPMLCQHCEDAPCEYVCPVNATVHSPDGLNEMIYNRCVGTRFCSNNCPYKVRRFNWFDYNLRAETEKMVANPDVTVRERGVMEKCTFCVQRIRRADIDAEISGSGASYQALQTACQQACPTRAIVFGSLDDPNAAVVHDIAAPHSYQVLHDLGTRPRVHYLARVSNPNGAAEEER